MTPHPQRCDEKCTFFEERVDDANKDYLYCKKAKCNIHYSWRMMSAFNGCASHSNAQSKRQEEALKHVEEAHELLFNSMLGVDEVEVKKLKRISELLLASKLKLRTREQAGEQK
jgi:hypothetical protein